jgi:magnesium chelatase family protein
MPQGEGSATVRARVVAARAVQAERYGSESTTNASARASAVQAAAVLSEAARAELGQAIDLLALSGRGADRVVRVARTLADLEGAAAVSRDHVAEAVAYRAPGVAGRERP